MYTYGGGFNTPNSYIYMTDNELKYLVTKQLKEETKDISTQIPYKET
jgi:hypothetical protein